jgi:hypothetical protein
LQVFLKSESEEAKDNAETNEFCRMSELAQLTAEFERDFVKEHQEEAVNINAENNADDKIEAVTIQNQTVLKENRIEESEETKAETQVDSKNDSREETPDYIPMTVREKFHVLRIEESVDKIDEIVPKITLQTVTRERTPIPKALSENFTRNNSIRVQTQETPIMFHDDIELCMLRKKEPPVPPQRRRSVKEIIESINRSQQLLKPNQKIIPKFETKFLCDSSNPLSYESLSYERESEAQINKLLTDLQNFDKLD